MVAGFSFQSATDPDTLDGADFAVEGIGADSGTQIDLGIAKRVPEPGASLLLAAFGALLALRRYPSASRVALASIRSRSSKPSVKRA